MAEPQLMAIGELPITRWGRLLSRSGYTARPVAGSPAQPWRGEVSTQFVGSTANRQNDLASFLDTRISVRRGYRSQASVLSATRKFGLG